jgi:hypothetical protein
LFDIRHICVRTSTLFKKWIIGLQFANLQSREMIRSIHFLTS